VLFARDAKRLRRLGPKSVAAPNLLEERLSYAVVVEVLDNLARLIRCGAGLVPVVINITAEVCPYHCRSSCLSLG
jgi:hypothetical protein